MHKSIRSPKIKVFTFLFLITALFVVPPAVYAQTISPTGELTGIKDHLFEITVSGSCVVEATVKVADPSIISGGGTKTETSPVFQMTSIKKGETSITITYKGQGIPAPLYG